MTEKKARERTADRISGATWEALAAWDPFRAVLTDVDERVKAGDPDAREAFYRSGEDYLEGIFGALRAHFGPPDPCGTAADFGCGVGRVTIPLARRCREVIGVDVSPTMLSLAAAYARERELSISLQPLREFLADDRSLDLLHSVLVLQHIWPSQGLRILESVLPRIRPGGLAVLHVPYFVGVKQARPLFRWARSCVPGFNAVANVARGVPAKTPYMPMHAWDLNRLVALLHGTGFGDLVLLRDLAGGIHSVIVLAKKTGV